MKPPTARFPWIPVELLSIVSLTGLITMPALCCYHDYTTWREEARAILVDGTLSVEEPVGKSAPWCYVLNHRDGHYYSKYGTFNSLLNVPPLLLERAITGSLPHESDSDGENPRSISQNPTRLVVFDLFLVLVSVGIALLLWLVSGFYLESRWKRALFVLMTLYGTTLWFYLRIPLSESTQSGLFLLFWLFFLQFSRHGEPLVTRPRRNVYLAWFALFLFCQTKITGLLFLPIFGIYLTHLASRSDLPLSGKLKFVLATVVLPAMLIVDAQGCVHLFKFGNPFLSGYHQYWEQPNPHSVWHVLWEFCFHAQWSFFTTFPVLVLAIPGWRPYFRQHMAEAVFLLAILVTMFTIVAPLPFWRGELAYGPRYFMYLLPVLSLPALYVFGWARGVWIAPVVLVGVFLIAAQFQVQRVAFFNWCGAFRKYSGYDPDVRSYFEYTPVPKICWDHLRCRDHLDELPYYQYLVRSMTPMQLAAWKDDLHSDISASNFYWFPGINK
jgi:hypothetical protein